MEGDNLDFFVTYKDHQAIISLSEYDTVGQLKIEIDNNFDIPVMDQEISGWYSIPESDDMILQSCSKPRDINCIVVTDFRSVNSVSRFIKENLLSDQMDTDMEKSNMEMQIEATRRLKQKVPKLQVQDFSFQDAISTIASSFKKKALILYLHNSEDVFSRNFINYVSNDELAGILEKSFVFVGWDIEDESYHRALLSALEPFESLLFVPRIITEKTGAAICLLLEDDEPVVFSYLKGDLAYHVVIEKLRVLHEQVEFTEATSKSASSMTAEKQDGLLQNFEYEATKSLKRKLPSNISVTFRLCTLDDALDFICTSPFDERKALLLYLHNSERPFSKMFSENLENGDMVQILNRSFLVLGWDVEDSQYHDALASALDRHVNLSMIADLVRNKVSIGLCIIPICGTIRLLLSLRGKTSLKEAIRSLTQVEQVFNEEISKEKELKILESKKNSENDLGSEKLHSIWADMLGNRDYDSFEYDQHQFLKDKIGFALKGPPEKETGYEKKTLAQIEKLYKVIITESNDIAEFKDKIEISFIYNCLEPLPEEKVKRGKKFDDYKPQTDVNPVPIFLLRKCQGSDNPCRVFVDNTGRVYQDWAGYLLKNKFPECEMIIPLDGRYQVEKGVVLLEKHLSPACHLDTKLLQVGDVAGTVAGVASGAVFIAAAIPAIPVAAPLLIGAVAVGAVAGTWAIGRSAYALIDRNRHKESLSFANSEARGAYLNIVAGTMGFVGAGANMAVAQLARSGANIGKGATILVNTVQALNISAGGASLVNSGYDVFDKWFNEDEPPSALAILQLSTSVLFFGHAVYNFKGAQTIIDETQARVLQDYNDSLRSNRHRKTFTKLVKQTLNTQGDGARGRAEVISAIRNIQNKDEVFAALTRNNKAMNQAGVKFSAEGGRITLGGMTVDMAKFIGLNKKQTEIFLGNLSQQQPSQQPVASMSASIAFTAAVKSFLSDIHVSVKDVNLDQVVTLTWKVLQFCSGDIKTKVVNAVHQAIQYVFDKLTRSMAEEIDKIIPKSAQYLQFLDLGISYFSAQVDGLEQQYQMYERTKDLRYYNTLFSRINPVYSKRIIELFQFVVNNCYSGEILIKAVIRELAGYVTAWVTRLIFENVEKKECERKRIQHSAGFKVKRVNCPTCNGYYFRRV